jgi:O-antigen/teichoic acid export membrane protein
VPDRNPHRSRMPAPPASEDSTIDKGPSGPGTDATKSLAPILKRGAAISAAGVTFVQIETLIQTLVLARILSPEEVGIFYAGTVLTTFLATFSDGGLRSALIQRHHGIEEAANSVFWASLAAGGLWGLLALASSPLVGLVFHSETVGRVAAVTSGSIVLHSLTNVPDGLLQRRFDFRQRLFVQPSVALTFGVTSVALCLTGMGVWGLVIASYSSLVVWLAVTWSLARWHPRRHMASWYVWRQLTRFGLPVLFGSAADRAKDVFDTIVVGSVLGPFSLGNYRYGRRLGMLPGILMFEIGSYILFPAFARTAAEPARFKSAFLRSLRALCFVAAPMAAVIVILGPQLVVLLLGKPWREAGLLFAALGAAAPGLALAAVGVDAIKGKGRTHLLNWINGSELVVGVLLLLALVRFGPIGIGLALSLTWCIAGVMSILLARGLAGVSTLEIANRLLPPVAAATISGLAWGLLEHLVVHTDRRGVMEGLTTLVAEGMGFLLVYLALMLMISPVTVEEMKATVMSRVGKDPQAGRPVRK